MTRVRVVLAASLMMVALALVESGCGGSANCTTAGSGSTTGNSGGTGGGSPAPASACAANSGGSGSSTTAGAYLFIADAGGIQGEVLEPSESEITVTSNFGTVTVSTNVPGTWMASSQSNYLYTAYPSVGEIYGWAVSAAGTVTTLNSGVAYPVSYLIGGAAGGTQGMIANPAGTMLFALDANLEQVHAYQIGSDGSLTEANNSPTQLPSGFEPYNLATDGLGAYLYVSNIVSGSVTSAVAGYSIGSDGTLTPLANSPFAMTLQQMQGESTGKYMIGTTSSFLTSDPHVYVATIQSNGALSTPTAYPTQNSPALVAVQPAQSGALVYSFGFPSDGVSAAVEGLQLNASTGQLTTVLGSPFSVSGTNGQFDTTGTYLFVVEAADSTSATLDAYDIVSTPDLQTPLASVGWASGAWVATGVP